jgi:hypothetical protein
MSLLMPTLLGSICWFFCCMLASLIGPLPQPWLQASGILNYIVPYMLYSDLCVSMLCQLKEMWLVTTKHLTL